MTLSGDQVAAELQLGFAVVDKPAHEQIESSIVVIVEPHRTGRPSGCCDSSFSRRVREGPVSIVVVQDAVGILRDIQIRKAVSLIIPNRHAHAIRISRHTRFLRYISERAIAIVVVKSITQWWRGLVEIAGPAVYEVNVHPPVIVVINKS